MGACATTGSTSAGMPLMRWNLNLASFGFRACDHAWLRHGDIPRKRTRRRWQFILRDGFESQSSTIEVSRAMTDSNFGATSASATYACVSMLVTIGCVMQPTTKTRRRERCDCKIMRSRYSWRATASIQIGAEPTLVIGELVPYWVFPDQPNICVFSHKFVLDPNLQGFDVGRHYYLHRLLMLDFVNSFIGNLLGNLFTSEHDDGIDRSAGNFKYAGSKSF